MKVVIFSGTTEGRELSRAVAALGIEATVCVATELGAEEQGRTPGITVCTGRLDADAMAVLLQGAALCVDATHPYATEATRNICAAAAAVGVEYHRLLRPASDLPAGSVVLQTAARAAESGQPEDIAKLRDGKISYLREYATTAALYDWKGAWQPIAGSLPRSLA